MVWPSFPCPDSSLVADIIFSDSVDCPAASKNPLLKETVLEHPFNQVLQLILPLNVDVPRGRLQESIQVAKKKVFQALPRVEHFFGQWNQEVSPQLSHRMTYFLIKEVPLHLLFHKVLITKYLLQGEITAVSTGHDVSLEDTVCITPSGKLILSVTEKTYHRLGIEGKLSILNRRKNVQKKEIIEIDLKSNMVLLFEKSKFYTRTFNCFRNSGLKFDILINWQPDINSGLSFQSIVKFFEYVKVNYGEGGGFMSEENASNLKIETCWPHLKSFDIMSPHVPKSLLEIPAMRPNDDIEAVVEDAQTWSGSQLTGISVLRDTDSLDVNSFGLDAENCQSLTASMCCTASGLFSSHDVMDIIREVEQNLHLMKSIVPFVVLVVNGFEDTPVSWTGSRNEHGKKLSGENLYGILMTTSSTSSSETSRKSLIWRLSDAYDFSIQKL